MKKYKILVAGLILVVFLSLAGWYFHHTNIPVLEPRGPIARQERNLILFTLGLSLIVVLPVFTLLFSFAWRYREGAGNKYSPDLAGNRIAETIWWLIPSTIILVLSIIIWNSSHTLDPYRPIASTTPKLTIQVVALDWKWLFIYPQQNIASVNLVQFPVNTPLDFQITSDAPMNSFWIPQLGSQIYAMPGMDTQLNLLASSAGSYYGSSANISGSGFAGMNFTAKATSASAFSQWVSTVRHSPKQLSLANYNNLAKPSAYNPVAYYSSPASSLYLGEINKYMMPPQMNMSASTDNAASGSNAMSGMYMP